uniref:UBC core domain-containing protein n=2 Tax=Chrysotila carterae TaxID=13221 RepID=A0A7S4BNU4_CHRCT
MLPPEYPFRPPSIALLTPNGRFELGKKICLSVSAHHPESWQPAWGIRTIIMALIAFFPTKAEGALAGLDYTDEERRALARQSLHWRCARCNACMATALRERRADDAERPSQRSSVSSSPVGLCFTDAPEAGASSNSAGSLANNPPRTPDKNPEQALELSPDSRSATAISSRRVETTDKLEGASAHAAAPAVCHSHPHALAHTKSQPLAACATDALAATTDEQDSLSQRVNTTTTSSAPANVATTNAPTPATSSTTTTITTDTATTSTTTTTTTPTDTPMTARTSTSGLALDPLALLAAALAAAIAALVLMKLKLLQFPNEAD